MRKKQWLILVCILFSGLATFASFRSGGAEDTPKQASDKTSPTKSKVRFPVGNGTVKISGKIKDYKGIYKTGKLSYREPGTGSSMNVVFPIAEDGSFSTSFDILYAMEARFDLEGSYYPVFLEPDNEYGIDFNKGHLVFNKNGDVNEQVGKCRYVLAKKFRTENKRAKSIHKEKLDLKSFRTFYDDLAEAKLQFLGEYCEKNGISDKVRALEESEIAFASAQALTNYFLWEVSSDGMPKLSPNLSVDDFYATLDAYPLQANDTCVARSYLGYTSNLVEILSFYDSPDEEIAFIKSSNEFSDEELVMVKGYIQGDEAVRKSEAFPKFRTKENIRKIYCLRARFRVAKLLKEATEIPKGIGRDMMISRSVAKNFLDYSSIVPNESEWKRIKQLIDNPAILQHLVNAATDLHKNETDSSDPVSQADTASFEEVRKKYIDVYRGKVIYIDFWSTWCGPCRVEIPDAKRLVKEFAGEEVVFLNLCAQSEKEEWESLVKQKEIGGENFLLSDFEYQHLAKHFGVNGFPTYVLVDRDGATVSNDAPRPSALEEITSTLNDILDK